MSQLTNILTELYHQNEVLKMSIDGLKRSPVESFFQFGSPLIVVFIAAGTSYLSGRHFFKKEYEKSIKLKLADKELKEFELTKNYEKDIEFKKMEFEQKRKDELKTIYAEANKYQQSYINSVRASQLLLIGINKTGSEYKITTNPEFSKILFDLMGDSKKDFLHYSQVADIELKNYIEVLSAYKYLKKGDTKITEHLNKIKSGIDFIIDDALIKATTKEDVNLISNSERKRFIIYWKKELRDETNNALDIILKNE